MFLLAKGRLKFGFLQLAKQLNFVGTASVSASVWCEVTRKRMREIKVMEKTVEKINF